ncbi:MAG: ComF family protein [Pyrinomonadaceae bacterium]|nr:ComF family protein [Pyrinomonadaceae bacterium]
MLCEKCGAFFGDKKAPVAVRCHKCDDHHYQHAVAAAIYEKAISASVISLKSTPKIGRRINDILIAAFKRSGFVGADLIIPVPLSRKRQIERGFNQAEVIARIVASAADSTLDTHSLIRTGHSPIHRVAMDAKARELTVRNTFEVTRPKLIAGKQIVLVDDVFTSGATTSHCARALKKSGAAEVNVFTLARAVMY